MEQQTLPIQKFSFKELGSNNNSSEKMVASGFRPLMAEINNKNTVVAAQNTPKETPKEPSFSTHDLLEAKQKTYEEAYAKGYNSAKSAEAEIEKQTLTTLSEINIKLMAVSEAVKTRDNENIRELAQLAIRISRKIAGNALKNEPYIEIEKLISDSLPLLFNEPSINIVVNPDLVANINHKITQLARSEGFKNNIEITGSSALTYGSCDIQFTGGGIKRDTQMLWSQIDKLCENL